MVQKAHSSLLFEETRRAGLPSEQDNNPNEYVEDDEPEEAVVNECVETPNGLSLPRAWAVKQFPHLRWADRTVFPQHDISFGKGGITPRDDRQRKFFGDLMEAARQPGPQNILANATTGAGKTASAIYMGWQLRTPTLVVVDSNKIANGWLNNFRKFFGKKWTVNRVGRAQQDVLDYRCKAFVISLVQSLSVRDYGEDFYRHFGLVAYDEIQIFGNPGYCGVMHQFPARVRAGFTAENRGGEFGKLIKTHMGDTRVVSKQEVLKPAAWILRNKLQSGLNTYSEGAMITSLSRIEERNQRIAKLVKTRGWDRQRNVLVLSNRTAHLVNLREMFIEQGIPADEIGIHVGSYVTDRRVMRYRYADSGKANTVHICENEREANALLKRLEAGNYDGIKLPSALCNRLQAGESVTWNFAPEEYKPTQNELDQITENCRIVNATYEIFAKGVDVPRLDMGVEALPYGNIKQPLGRVLRILPDKLKPEWYAVDDYYDIEENFGEGKLRTIKMLNQYFSSKTRARITALQRAKADIYKQ